MSVEQNSQPDAESSTPPVDLLVRLSTMFFAAVIGFSVFGYLAGLADGVPQPTGLSVLRHATPNQARQQAAELRDSKVIAAISYAEVPDTAMGPTATWSGWAVSLAPQADELFAEVVPSPADKEASAILRASRRSFNGAPPFIPHSIEGTNDAACYACHAGGMQLPGIKASVMSHRYLPNCTQCHAPPPPSFFQALSSDANSDFVGLPAPRFGARAYPGAPPIIPHSQWMRENCAGCHAAPNGWAGMETTHPWRINCTQCHAPSAILDQAIASASPPLGLPEVKPE